MNSPDPFEPAITEDEAAMAKTALDCLMTALDHSTAPRIRLVVDPTTGEPLPTLSVPPQALRLFADILRCMARRQQVLLMPQKQELTTQEAAAYLNVSRPFVIAEIEAGRLRCTKVNRHRRIAFDDLMRYRKQRQQQSEAALQQLAKVEQELGLGL